MSARPDSTSQHFVLLSGGVGGAKLALGMSRVLPPDGFTIIANTGDDFEHLGLYIAPDLDTLMYTLSGEVNPETGWGRRNESWNCMSALEAVGGPTWFRLGDRDLATHLERTRRLAAGASLSEVTHALCRRTGVQHTLVPMSDDPVRTRVLTVSGTLDFQEYFVRERAEPAVRELQYAGADTAEAAPGVLDALNDSQLAGIVIAPSNPYLSIDPILAVPAIRNAIQDARVPRIAVSPIVGGRALKGPTAKIMTELGQVVSAQSVAAHYAPLVDHLLVDTADSGAASAIRASGVSVTVCPTVMHNEADKITLAQAALAACEASS